MIRFIIFPVFNGQIREALVQVIESNNHKDTEEFSVHPKVASEHFISYGRGKYTFKSDRPIWRKRGVKRRPNYTLTFGEIRVQSYQEILIKAIDQWVEKNLD